MKEYRITYINDEDREVYEGCGRGFNGQDAVRNFLSWAGSCQILGVRFFAEYAY